MVRTPSGYVQQNPWIGVANKQLELMGRFMTELGMTPAARSRVCVAADPARMTANAPVELIILSGVPRPDTDPPEK